jgi:SAM-dependent methyltransferase
VTTTTPFLERMREHAADARPRRLGASGDDGGADHRGPQVNRDQLAFWQSPVARASVNRRVTGDPGLAPEIDFARRHGPVIPAPHVVSLKASDAKFEIALIEAGSCERLTGLDPDPGRRNFANGRIPVPLRGRMEFIDGDLDTFQAPEPVGAIVARSVLHGEPDLEARLDLLHATLVPDGLLFVDDFVGPARFQWTDRQLRIVNRLLERLPDELRVDLAAEDGRLKDEVRRPDAADWAAANPHQAVRSDEVVALLDDRFERVDVRLYGGAVFHQLFSRIMGNFVGRPELIGLLMEVDGLLTDEAGLSSDYVWGAWRRA